MRHRASHSGPATSAGATGAAASGSPPRGGLVLATLILGAAVANLNMSVANVALPTIDRDLDATQTQLDLVAVGFTLGLAASVLYLGALADRYGRRRMLLLGLLLSIPTAALAAWSGDIHVLMVARFLGGLAAGMAYPTTLSIVTALFSGAARTRSIALWSGIGGGASALGPLISGLLLQEFWWGSVFAVTIPIAVVGIVCVLLLVPKHAGEGSEPVDNFGGVLSVVFIGSLVLAINMAPVAGSEVQAIVLTIVAVAAGVSFFWRQKRAATPLYDLHVAARRTFWVAGVTGIIVFGTLMGSLFIGQQFLQDVLGYTSLQAGAGVLPAALMMILMSPVSARVIQRRGARFTMACGIVPICLGFVVMLFWQKGIGYAPVGLAYGLVGIGVGLAGAPASRSLMSSVPVRRAGMGSATTDLQRDLGGAIMQSVLGALLTLRYSSYFAEAFTQLPPETAQKMGDETAAQIQDSFGGAADVAKTLPDADAQKLMDAAEQAFTQGSHTAILVALVIALGGLVLVLVAFPRKKREDALEAGFAAEEHDQD
jgi:EmrB/QacA subfamily drug resistance transporter